jgi:deferrochelatase/peroxidase EfeB
VFVRLSEEIESVMTGTSYSQRGGGFPPLGTGLLHLAEGSVPPWVVVSVGNSIFDSRFGLSMKKPSELQEMPKFANDYLVKEDRSHGDIAVTVG